MINLEGQSNSSIQSPRRFHKAFLAIEVKLIGISIPVQ